MHYIYVHEAVAWVLRSRFAAGRMLGYNERWRAPAHCGMVYLVRSGTKQPKPFTASAADQARLLIQNNSCRGSCFRFRGPLRSSLPYSESISASNGRSDSATSGFSFSKSLSSFSLSWCLASLA
jgi:hypothetical protein